MRERRPADPRVQLPHRDRLQVQGGHDVKIAVRNRCSDFKSYRAARVKSLFNAESGCNFDLEAVLPNATDEDWKLGLVVGPSGSGKSSIGRELAAEGFAAWQPTWPADAPIVDA